ncbi:MAG TPA: ABC transporter [Gammaproteobacteria bacterium]|nr:ABC transporter [Gammaproteobacteria bacterium]
MTLLHADRIEAGVGNVAACRDLELSLEAGTVWSILGRNGIGKTTLLLTLAGLKPLKGGQICLDGRSLDQLSRRARARKIGLLFQHPEIQFPTTVGETVMSGRHPWIERWRDSSERDQLIVDQELERVGLQGFGNRSLSSLSGGERRRVELAALAAQQTEMVFMDEPVNHLDLHFQTHLMKDFLADCRAKGRAVMMVMHDVNLAVRFSDHLLLLFGDGETTQGPVDLIASEENLSRLYQHQLHRYPAGNEFFFYPA